MRKQEKKEKSNDSLNTNGTTIRLGEEMDRVRLVREIGDLAHIPEIKSHMVKALAEAKKKYQDKIEKFQDQKKSLENELSKTPTDDSKRKFYYFEVAKVADTGADAGCRWELGKFKLKAPVDAVNMIFSRFAANIDSYAVSPNKVQVETYYSAPLEKWFKIDFTKSSEDRVVGFVKILDENFVRKETDTMLTVNTKTDKTLQKERVIQLMEEDPHFFEDISFYAGLRSQANGGNATI